MQVWNFKERTKYGFSIDEDITYSGVTNCTMCARFTNTVQSSDFRQWGNSNPFMELVNISDHTPETPSRLVVLSKISSQSS